MIFSECPRSGIIWFYIAILQPKDAAGMTNSVYLDQTAPNGLHCLYRIHVLRHVLRILMVYADRKKNEVYNIGVVL